MGRQFRANDVAELALPAGPGVAAVPIVGPTGLPLSAGSSIAAPPVTGPAEVALLTGPARVGAPPFDEPGLLSYGAVAAALDVFIYITFHSIMTDGEPCTLQFYLSGPKVNIFFPATTVESNGPVTQVVSGLDVFTFGGITYDLYWRWWSGVEDSGGWILEAPGYIRLPAFGDPPVSL